MLKKKERESEAGIALVTVTLAALLSVIFCGAVVSLSLTNTGSSASAESGSRAEYIVNTALNTAFAEIVSQEDKGQDGLGAVGVNAPIVVTDSQGNAVGEWKTVIDTSAGQNVLLAVAAVPSFEDPEYLSGLQAVVTAEVEFLLKPKPAAIAVSGPLKNPKFPSMKSSTVHIDGGEKAAFVLSNEEGYEGFMDAMGDKIASGAINEDDILGGETSVYDHSTAGEIELPVVLREASFLSAEQLNDFRNALRAEALAMADNADIKITSKINGDRTWGTESDPVVVSIDAKAIGKDRVFNTEDQTITGHGTLVIEHTVRPRKNLNLNWTGDVYVVGFDGDGSDLLYLYGANAQIDGNLILLSSDHTEASLEMTKSTRSDVGSRDRRGTHLTVNGALLCLAESRSHEAEVEVESSSRLDVAGLLGVFGSRIEIEVSSLSSEMNIKGTLAVGMAQDFEEISRTDDFEIQMTGKFNAVYYEELVEQALAGLKGLEANKGVSETPMYSNFWISGMAIGTASGCQVLETIDGLVASQEEIGVNEEIFAEDSER